MYTQTPSSSPPETAQAAPPPLRHILWVPGSLLGITLLLGFRFYESGSIANIVPISGQGKMVLGAAETATPVTIPGAGVTEKNTQQPTDTPPQGEAKDEDSAKKNPSNAPAQSTGTLLKGEIAKPEEPAKEEAKAKVKVKDKDKAVDESVDILNLTTEEVKILQSLALRRGDVEKREKVLLEREQLLEVAENRIDEKVQELQKIRGILTKMLDKFQAHEKERMMGLVKIYELMKPDKASAIFEGLSLDVLLDVVDMMKEAKLSPILGSMNPRAAQRLTEELAARRKFTEELNRLNQQEEAASQELNVPESMADKPSAQAPEPEVAPPPQG